MPDFAHVIFRDFDRHICFIRASASAVKDDNIKNRAAPSNVSASDRRHDRSEMSALDAGTLARPDAS
jgi:hypothetical protein